MTRSSGNAWSGYLYIAAAALFWGISASLGRAAFTGRLFPGFAALAPIDPLILAQTRATFSFIVLFAVLGLRRRSQRTRPVRQDLVGFALLGVLGVAASNYFYYLAIQRTNVATAIVVQYTAPLWVLLYAVVRGLQKATPQRIAAVALAVTGIALVVGIIGPSQLHLDKLGIAAAMLAAFSFSYYNIAGHGLLEKYDRWTVLLYTTFTASLFWLVINPPGKIWAAHYSSMQWLFLVIFSLISVLAPFSCYFAGLQRLEPTRAIITSCLEPVFSILIAAVFLGELLRPLQTLGMAAVLAAIVVVQLGGRAEDEQIMPTVTP